MAHTEKCRDCMNENACDYINCRFDENKRIYNRAIDDVMKIYNEMQPQLATHVYEFGKRIEQLKK